MKKDKAKGKIKNDMFNKVLRGVQVRVQGCSYGNRKRVGSLGL